MEFSEYIWNHHEKCIQISTNMPGIGLEICDICEILRNKTIFCIDGETNPRVQSITTYHAVGVSRRLWQVFCTIEMINQVYRR